MQLRGSFWRGPWAHVRRAIKAARPSLERFRWGKSSSLKSRLNSASVALGLSQIIVAQAALRPTGPATAAQGGKRTSQRARRGANFAPSNRILRPDPLRIRPLQCQRADVRHAAFTTYAVCPTTYWQLRERPAGRTPMERSAGRGAFASHRAQSGEADIKQSQRRGLGHDLLFGDIVVKEIRF